MGPPNNRNTATGGGQTLKMTLVTPFLKSLSKSTFAHYRSANGYMAWYFPIRELLAKRDLEPVTVQLLTDRKTCHGKIFRAKIRLYYTDLLKLKKNHQVHISR